MDIVLIFVLLVWILITVYIIIDRKRWEFGIGDVITLSVFVLVGLTFIGLII